MKLDETIIARPKDHLRAWVMAADLGGLDDKQAAAACGMDPATWSRFKQGDVGIKPNAVDAALDQFGNELPLAYWAYRRGYVLTPMESEMERRLRLANEALAEERKKSAVLLAALQGRAV